MCVVSLLERSSAVKKSEMDLVVGGSILLSLLILIGGVLWLKDLKVTRKLVNYTVLFPNIGTLQMGDPVTVEGVKKGTVGDIRLKNDSVAVTIKLDKDITLTDSAKITVQNIGLLGERMIGIQLSSQGTPHKPTPKGAKPRYIPGYFDPGIGEAMGMVGTVLGDVQVLVADLAEIVDQTVGDTAFVGLFKDILGRLDRVTLLAESIIDDNKGDIEQAIANIHQVSVELQQIVERNRDGIDQIVQDGSHLTTEALAITDGLDSVLVSMRTMLTSIENGEGSLGMLIEDETFFSDLKESIANVDTLVSDVKKNGLKLRVKLGFKKSK